MRATLERELKLRAAAGFELPDLPGEPLSTRHFSSTYHDTPDHRLAEVGVTLRYRAENGRGAWQLKLPHEHARVELELEGYPDAVPARFRDLVAAALRDHRVAPVATLDTVRRGILVRRDGLPVAEVVVDQVVVRAGDAAVRAFDELEVELVEGEEHDLMSIAAALRSAGAAEGDQRPKLLQALGLERAAEIAVDRSDTPRVQLSAMLQAQYRAVLAHDPGTRLGADSEELHQHRVAVRRMRALLRAGRPMLDREWVSELRGELAWVGAALGEVRDLDVMIAHLEQAAQTLGEADREAFGRLLAVLGNRREAARALMLSELREPRYLSLLDRLERELPQPPARGEEVEPARLAATAQRRLARMVRELPDTPSDEQLHAVRIAAKRARYAAELAVPSRGQAASRVVRAAKRLQDVLGDHQDAVVAEATLRELARASEDAEAAFGAGILAQRESDRRDAARAAFPDAWREVRRRARRAWR